MTGAGLELAKQPNDTSRGANGTGKIKIGILASDVEGFGDWELKIFELIARDDRYEISAIILDGRPPEGAWVKARRKLKDRKFLSTLLYNVAMKIERRLFAKTKLHGAETFRSILPSVERIEVFPTRKGYVDFFSPEDSQKIRNLGLDVLLRHGFNIIKGDVFSSARFGIWSFHHADNRVFRGSPAGFWEVYHKTPLTGVTLQILNAELDGGEVIGRAFYNTKWNSTLNNQFILDKSSSLLMKSLGQLYESGRVTREEPSIYSGKLYKAPSTIELAIYVGRVLAAAALRTSEHGWAALGRRKNMWNLFFGKGPVDQAPLWRSVEVKANKGEYWADPFLLRRDGKLYVFFENYVYATNKGKISVGTWDGRRFTCLGDALDLAYHVSFPYLFEDGDELYMVPEACQSGQVGVWRCTKFPFEWEQCASALQGMSVADAVIFKRNGEWWMFASVCADPLVDHCSELYVYRVDGPMLRSITPHRQNPVVINSEFARNGGRVFERDGKLFRVSQNNSNGIYGYGFNIMEITELSLDAYSEHPVQRVQPSFKPGLIGTHHLDVSEDVFVIDGCRRFAR